MHAHYTERTQGVEQFCVERKEKEKWNGSLPEDLFAFLLTLQRPRAYLLFAFEELKRVGFSSTAIPSQNSRYCQNARPGRLAQ